MQAALTKVEDQIRGAGFGWWGSAGAELLPGFEAERVRLEDRLLVLLDDGTEVVKPENASEACSPVRAPSPAVLVDLGRRGPTPGGGQR